MRLKEIIYYYSYMMSCVILLASVQDSLSLSLLRSTRQLPLSLSVGHLFHVILMDNVVNVTSATHTVIQQVKGGSCIPNTVCVSTCYGEYTTHFYNTTGEIMSLICAVCNDISIGRCTVSC